MLHDFWNVVFGGVTLGSLAAASLFGFVLISFRLVGLSRRIASLQDLQSQMIQKLEEFERETD